MAALVIGAAGALLAPAGYAALGWAIGSTLGGMLFPTKVPGQHTAQPLMDLKITGTEYGQPIPYVRGSVPIAGQMWWNTDRRPTTTTVVTESGGKGGGGSESSSSTTTYDMDCLIGLADNEIAGIAKIWNNGKLIWTADADATAGSIAASAAYEGWTRLTVYTGSMTQLPDPTYEAAVGTANAPAYRGRAYAFIEGLKLGQSGQVPNLTFEVVADGGYTLIADPESLYTLPAGNTWATPNPTMPRGFLNAYDELWVNVTLSGEAAGSGRNAWLLDLATNTITQTYGWYSSGYSRPAVGVMNNGDFIFGDPSGARQLYKASRSGGALTAVNFNAFGMPLRPECDASGVLWDTSTSGNYQVTRLSSLDWQVPSPYGGTYTRTNYGIGPLGTLGVDIITLADKALAVAGRVYAYGINPYAGKDKWAYMTIATGVWSAAVTIAGTSIALLGRFDVLVGGDGYVYAAFLESGNAKVRQWTQDGVVVATATLGAVASMHSVRMALDTHGDLWVSFQVGTGAGPSQHHRVNTADMTVLSSAAADATEYSVFPGVTSDGAVLTTQGASSPGTSIRKVAVSPVVTKYPPAVSTVVSALCLRAGLTAGQIDVTGLSTITRTVRSLALSQITSTRQALELLMSTYFFEMVVSDKIYFRARGGSSVATIPYLDLGASEGGGDVEPLALRQLNELEIPAQIALTYPNVDDDYQTDTQYSDRLITAAAGTVSAVQMAIGMTPAEAKAVADTMLLDQAASVISTQISLLGDYSRLEPTDPVTVTAADGSTFRLRLVKKTDSYPLLTFDAVLDDVSVLSSQGITSADYTPSTVVAPATNTLMELLDIPILQDADDNAGFYVAAKGDSTNYPGAAIFGSTDNVEYTRKATVLESAVFGTCTTTLGDWTGPRVFDEMNSVTVNVGDGTLASSTRDAILNSLSVNAMLVGSELIQFHTATLVSAGVYTLTGLLRGGRGTEWAMTGHAVNERCVLLRGAGLRRIIMQNNEIGLSKYYKGVTLGRSLSSATAETFTDNAVGLKPFSPIDLRAARDAATGDITFTWQRRTRYSVRMIGALGISVPLGEDTEAYEIDVYSDGTYTTIVRTISATTVSASYSAAEQTADGLTPGNTVYAKVYQRSAAIGRGYPLQQAA